MQRMSEPPLKTCAQCGGELRKLLYPVGVQFKGSGFYTTDYKAAGKNLAASSGSATEAKADGAPGGADQAKADAGSKVSASADGGA